MLGGTIGLNRGTLGKEHLREDIGRKVKVQMCIRYSSGDFEEAIKY